MKTKTTLKSKLTRAATVPVIAALTIFAGAAGAEAATANDLRARAVPNISAPNVSATGLTVRFDYPTRKSGSTQLLGALWQGTLNASKNVTARFDIRNDGYGYTAVRSIYNSKAATSGSISSSVGPGDTIYVGYSQARVCHVNYILWVDSCTQTANYARG